MLIAGREIEAGSGTLIARLLQALAAFRRGRRAGTGDVSVAACATFPPNPPDHPAPTVDNIRSIVHLEARTHRERSWQGRVSEHVGVPPDEADERRADTLAEETNVFQLARSLQSELPQSDAPGAEAPAVPPHSRDST